MQLLVERHAAYAAARLHVRPELRRRLSGEGCAVHRPKPARVGARPEARRGQLGGEEVEELAPQPARVLASLTDVLDCEGLFEDAAAHAHLGEGAERFDGGAEQLPPHQP